FVVAREIEHGVAADLVEKERTADLEDRSGETFAGTVRMLRKVRAKVIHLRRLRRETDEVEQSGAGMVEVDLDRAGDRVRDARGGIVEVIERGLDHDETEVRQAL